MKPDLCPLLQFCLSVTLLAAGNAWSQAAPGGSDNSSQMQFPPPASGDAYPTEVGSEARSNFLSGGLVVVTAYDDNVLGGETSKPVSDVSYSIRPTISLNQSTSRQTRTFAYSPGFTFYQPTSALNAADQEATGDYRYRLSPHVTVEGSERFARTSSVFSQPDLLPGGTISGSPQPAAVIAPFAGQMTNATSGDLSYQFSANGMIGATGTYSNQSYLTSSQATGLFNSSSSGGSFSYSIRFSREQYFGLKYQYGRGLSSSEAYQSDVQSQGVIPFYTIYLNRTFSISLSGGPQYIIVSASTPRQRFESWEPAASASIGWQGMRTSLAGGYSRVVSNVGGLLGAFDSTTANASAHWQMSRTWSVGSNANYGMQKNTFLGVVTSAPGGGHSISGSITVDHSINEHFRMSFGYNRLHQSYGGIAAISNAPDVDRVLGSISYQFTRPLGR